MNTTVETMQKYINDVYGIEFKLEHYKDNLSERWLKYKKGKKEYTLSCDYANHPEMNAEETEYWSIYIDFMDYEKWWGYGYAVIDLGTPTIDSIMYKWGFEKTTQYQLSLFEEMM